MRSISLKTTQIKMPGQTEAVEIAYTTMMLEVLGAPLREGITVRQQRIDNAIMDTLEAAAKAKAKVVLLEEPQWARLVERMNGHQFPFSSRAVVEVVDAIEKAEQHDPNAPAADKPKKK